MIVIFNLLMYSTIRPHHTFIKLLAKRKIIICDVGMVCPYYFLFSSAPYSRLRFDDGVFYWYSTLLYSYSSIHQKKNHSVSKNTFVTV